MSASMPAPEIVAAVFAAQRRQQAVAGVETHVRDFFAGRQVQAHHHDLGPGRREAVPGLRIIGASPGPRGNVWTYVTAAGLR